MDFAQKLKKIRKERGLTQVQLATKAHLSTGAIGGYESGAQKNISFESICKLAKALEVEPEELGLQRRYDLEERMQDVGSYLRDKSSRKKWRELSEAFQQLNDLGQNEALKRIQEMTEISRYRM